MKVLKSRLDDLREKEQQAKLDAIGGEKKAIGSVIRFAATCCSRIR